MLTVNYWNVQPQEEWAVPYPPIKPDGGRETGRPLNPPVGSVLSRFQEVVNEKNATVVSTIGFAPDDLWDGPTHCLDGLAANNSDCLTKQELTTLKQGYCTKGKDCSPVKRQNALRKYDVESKFAVGDRVRMLERTKPLEKASSTPNWGRAVHRITVIPTMLPNEAAGRPPPLTSAQLWNVLNGVPNDEPTFQGGVARAPGVNPQRSRRIEIVNEADAGDVRQAMHWELTKVAGRGIGAASMLAADRKRQKRAMGQTNIAPASGRQKGAGQNVTRAAVRHDTRG